jgi:hypothetical protein
MQELYQARDALLSQIHELLNQKDRAFLISVKNGEPSWELFAYPQAANRPAIQWDLHNISLMQSKKKAQTLSKLEKVLTGRWPN